MTGKIVEHIREHFAAGINGFRKIQGLPSDCPAWTVCREDGYFGVCIPNPGMVVINERFASISIESQDYPDTGDTSHMLMLLCSSRKLRYEFASVAAQFIEPGPESSNRKKIQRNPFEWWKRWRELVGNRIGEKKPYSVIGEMLVVERLLKDGQQVVWGGPAASTHDIDTGSISAEVKSTLQRAKTEITVSSPYQLDGTKPLWLYIVKFEENPKDGLTISEQAAILEQLGYDSSLIENQLARLGFVAGTHGRKQRYRVLEKRKYLVDDSFPKITPASFIGGHMPTGITHIEYTVNLDGLPYESWE